MKSQKEKYTKTLLIVLFLLLLSCATPGQSQRYTQGSVIDTGLYSVTGPPGDGWLSKMQEGVLRFYRPITSSENDQFDILAIRNDFDEKRGRYSSEEELALEWTNSFEKDLLKNAKEANCLSNDMCYRTSGC
jgi:hypothetical protein